MNVGSAFKELPEGVNVGRDCTPLSRPASENMGSIGRVNDGVCTLLPANVGVLGILPCQVLCAPIMVLLQARVQRIADVAAC